MSSVLDADHIGLFPAVHIMCPKHDFVYLCDRMKYVFEMVHIKKISILASFTALYVCRPSIASFPVSTPQLFFAQFIVKSWRVETGNEARPSTPNLEPCIPPCNEHGMPIHV